MTSIPSLPADLGTPMTISPLIPVPSTGLTWARETPLEAMSHGRESQTSLALTLCLATKASLSRISTKVHSATVGSCLQPLLLLSTQAELSECS